jgi:hypothetical protein
MAKLVVEIVAAGGQPAISDSCTLVCPWSGQIQLQYAGQADIDVE